MCPLECPISILLICPDILQQVIVFEYLYAHPSDLSAQLWQDEGGTRSWVKLTTPFLYNSPFVVYNPNVLPGEENNPYFVLDS